MPNKQHDEFSLAGVEDGSHSAPALYSPERAQRLVKLNRALWGELQDGARTMWEALNADPYFGRWRTRIRMLGAIFEIFAPEFDLFLECRSTLSDREEDEGYKVIGTIEETVNHLLEQIEADRDDYEEYLVSFIGEDFETGIGPGFLVALERFKAAYQDWGVAWSMMDNIDSSSQTDDLAAAQAAFDECLSKLDARLTGRVERAGA